jgi:hypothetical protein
MVIAPGRPSAQPELPMCRNATAVDSPCIDAKQRGHLALGRRIEATPLRDNCVRPTAHLDYGHR